jgi:hypothetical protein
MRIIKASIQMRNVRYIKFTPFLIFAVFLINLIPFQTHASDIKIINDGVFGISEDNADVINGDYILKIEDSLYTNYLKKHRLMKIYAPLSIHRIFKFEELQNLCMLLIVDSSQIKNPWGGYNRPVLYNLRDSSYCYLDGEISSFKSLVRKYLPHIIENNLYGDLINLYLNSNSRYCSFYLISTYYEYEKIWASNKYAVDSILSKRPLWDDEKKDKIKSSLGYDDKNIEKDLIKAKEIIEDYRIEKSNSDIVAPFCSWDHCSGNIEYWRIKISPEKFSIMERKILKKEMGPRYLFAAY